jgi:hypothetical protein
MARLKQTNPTDGSSFGRPAEGDLNNQQFQPVENPLIISQMTDNADDKNTYDRL